MSAANFHRQPEGLSTGGQFAAVLRPEPNIGPISQSFPQTLPDLGNDGSCVECGDPEASGPDDTNLLCNYCRDHFEEWD